MKNNLFAVLTVLVLSSCQQQAEQTSIEQTAESTKVATVEKPQVKETIKTAVKAVDKGFDFTYNDLDGKPVSLSDFRGKWVVANFWATWCPPCRKEIPDVVKCKTQYGDHIEIIGINNEDADVEIVRAFAEDYHINYPVVQADVYNPSDFDRQNTMGLPTTVIFNPQGVQVSKRVGPMHFKDLQMVIGATPTTP